MPSIVDAMVVNQEEVAPNHFRLYLNAPEIAAEAKPGQFLHVSCGSTLDPLLRRPISIHMIQRNKGTVILFYRVAGYGTALLARQKAGSVVNLVGPLGKGFTMPDAKQHIILVAGGIGIAPLLYLSRELTGSYRNAQVFFGAATAQQLFFLEEIRHSRHQLHIATDDGSAGSRGTVTATLANYLATLPPGLLAKAKVFACGPKGMLRHLSEVIKDAGITGEMSLEERMGCGVGACLSCVCKTKDGAEDWRYSRICVDGPVFSAAEVVWND